MNPAVFLIELKGRKVDGLRPSRGQRLTLQAAPTNWFCKSILALPVTSDPSLT